MAPFPHRRRAVRLRRDRGCSTLPSMRPVRPCAAIAGLSFGLLLSGCAPIGAPAPPPAAPPAPAAAVRPLYPPAPAEAEAEIVRWFSAAGYRDFQVEALVEHARAESGFHACAVGPGGLRYTFQWGGARLRRLQRFAGTEGCPQLHTQLAFADRELRTEPNYACFWAATSDPPGQRRRSAPPGRGLAGQGRGDVGERDAERGAHVDHGRDTRRQRLLQRRGERRGRLDADAAAAHRAGDAGMVEILELGGERAGPVQHPAERVVVEDDD